MKVSSMLIEVPLAQPVQLNVELNKSKQLQLVKSTKNAQNALKVKKSHNLTGN